MLWLSTGTMNLFPINLAISLAVLSLERSNFLLHALLIPLSQLRTIAQEKQNLHPHKQRRQQKRLHQIIQQRRSPALKGPVSHKLRQPRHHVNPTSPVVHSCRPVGAQQVVRKRGPGDDDGGNETSRDGFEEDVEDRIDEAADRAEVGREVFVL